MLHNAMAVLDLFTFQHSELGVIEAAELLGRHKSTVSRWLSAMEEAGFLERDPATQRYRISMRLASLAEVARRSTSLQRLARPILERLAAETGETTNLTVLDGGEAVNIEGAESPRPIMHVGWVGRRLPLHASASAKALLAWRPPEEVRAFFRPPLARFTPATITDPTAFEVDLFVTRERGYATTWAELADDLAAAAAPVRDHRGQVVAAIAVSAPISRVSREQLPALAAPVVRAAEELSRKMGYRPAMTAALR
jgi:DNA-binding IclR family transcriptional regulator